MRLLLDTQFTELNTKMKLDKIHFWLIDILWNFMKPIGKEVNDDQVAVVMARLDEAGQTPLQSLSNPALATKRGSSQQDPHKAARQS
ncbi:hypothetical protein BASA50_002739 [Batrachochytrium salamandrivorans]|uniref:PWI domain-containing protein n=1 Tax=Batrachochytrium salamandrivorans TaxID=1357716 RepID=A0ABQ8FKB7_9FUNG|nr:hypothetical protein BASA50_002739 [Batrachochytrium salamandrivorans]KAH9267452.1 hypothetical protein BASA83_009991 [Batrachochytrium salamandrivorans]